ncbi:hypothetical protein O181_062190 [Austropuccinia psidii MF-1]|uniref:Uncharacterized protein n=1 Tax=Austropuccinia psidii MF-1 TaxID=1389203 RepID=A0A9Q3I152_9BASI|nr:hypothetical protein [Austropuccinia psidii MF-1]
MRRKLDMAIEYPEKWLGIYLSRINEADEGESPQKKFKRDLIPPEANSSGIEGDYSTLFLEEMGYNTDIENNSINKEQKYDTIQPLEKIKVEEVENKTSRIPEDRMDQVTSTGMTRRIKQRPETVLDEGKLVEAEDDFILYQKNNANWKDNINKVRTFEHLNE